MLISTCGIIAMHETPTHRKRSDSRVTHSMPHARGTPLHAPHVQLGER